MDDGGYVLQTDLVGPNSDIGDANSDSRVVVRRTWLQLMYVLHPAPA